MPHQCLSLITSQYTIAHDLPTSAYVYHLSYPFWSEYWNCFYLNFMWVLWFCYFYPQIYILWVFWLGFYYQIVIKIDYSQMNWNTCLSACIMEVNLQSVSHALNIWMQYGLQNIPDSKVHGANMGPIWSQQDPVGPLVGPMNFAIWDDIQYLWIVF